MPDVSNRKRRPNGEFDNEDQKQKPATGEPKKAYDENSMPITFDGLIEQCENTGDGTVIYDDNDLNIGPDGDYVEAANNRMGEVFDNMETHPVNNPVVNFGQEYEYGNTTAKVFEPKNVGDIIADGEYHDGARNKWAVNEHGELVRTISPDATTEPIRMDVYRELNDGITTEQAKTMTPDMLVQNTHPINIGGQASTERPHLEKEEPYGERQAANWRLRDHFDGNAHLTTLGDDHWDQHAYGYVTSTPPSGQADGWHYYSLNVNGNGNHSLSAYDPSKGGEVFATQRSLDEEIKRGTFDEIHKIDQDPYVTLNSESNINMKEMSEFTENFGGHESSDNMSNAWANSMTGRDDVHASITGYDTVLIQSVDGKDRTVMQFSGDDYDDDDDNYKDTYDENFYDDFDDSYGGSYDDDFDEGPIDNSVILVTYTSQHRDSPNGEWKDNPAASGEFTSEDQYHDIESQMKRATSFHKKGDNLANYPMSSVAWYSDGTYEDLNAD